MSTTPLSGPRTATRFPLTTSRTGYRSSMAVMFSSSFPANRDMESMSENSTSLMENPVSTVSLSLKFVIGPVRRRLSPRYTGYPAPSTSSATPTSTFISRANFLMRKSFATAGNRT